MLLRISFLLILGVIASTDAFFLSKLFKSSPKPVDPQKAMTKDIENALRTGKFVKVYVPVYRIHYANTPPVQSFAQAPIIYNTPESTPHQVIPKRDDYPMELINMAKELGFTEKELAQMPPFEEIQSIAGTSTKEETIDFIKDFMSTEEGRDMVKAFLDTSEDGARRRRSAGFTYFDRNRYNQYREVADKDVTLLRQIISGQLPYRRRFRNF